MRPQTKEDSAPPTDNIHRIFIAEDNPADVYMIDYALRESGAVFELEVATTGKEALSFLELELHTSERPLALVLLDLNLPQHDGAEILQFIRKDPRLSAVPVVLFTSSDSPKDRLTAMREGAHRFIRKPSVLEEYIAIGATLRAMLEDNVLANTLS